MNGNPLPAPLVAGRCEEHRPPIGRGLQAEYVAPSTGSGQAGWTISTSGGTRPLWGRSGTELFYLDGSGAMTRVPIQTAPTFSAGTPTTLFDTRCYTSPNPRSYDVSPDGQRFLMIKATTGTEQAARMVVVLNWLEELKAKLPAK